MRNRMIKIQQNSNVKEHEINKIEILTRHV